VASAETVTVSRLRDLPSPQGATAAIEAIFWETSHTSRFPSEADRTAYRDRWLGRYLEHFPEEAFVALSPEQAIIGYLVGCLVDPASHPLFVDVTYFPLFAHLTPDYPAHLHINLTAAWRGRGIGKRLIEAFADHAARRGIPGIHVVTGDGSRNNAFYLSCGFERLAYSSWNGNAIAFFGRRLNP